MSAPRPVVVSLNGGNSHHAIETMDDTAKSDRRRPWTAAEVRRLEAAYCQGGLLAAIQALPGRSAYAIRQKADDLGLRPPQGKRPKRKPYTWAPHQDDYIRRKLSEPRAGKGVWLEMVRGLQRPRQVIKARALKLGLCAPRLAPLPWRPEEDAILRANAGKGLKAMRRALKAAGFVRSEAAIKCRAFDINGSIAIERREGTMTASALAALLGVDSKTVCSWVASGELKAKPLHGNGWAIKEADVRRWMIEHPARVHLGKIEAAGSRYWLIELLARGAVAARSGASGLAPMEAA